MKFQSVIVLVLLVVYEASGALLQLPKTVKCLKDSECGVGECCAKQIGPMIISRDIHTTLDPATAEGKCKPYLQCKEWCGGIWKDNGECGCAPSLTCHWYPPANFGTLGKRTMAPGNYLCEPKGMA